MSILTDDERARVHREVDKLLDMPCMDGFLLFFASFTNEGDVDVATVGKGSICPACYLDAILRILVDQSSAMDSPIAQKMRIPLRLAQKYLEHLKQTDVSDCDSAATEVRQ